MRKLKKIYKYIDAGAILYYKDCGRCNRKNCEQCEDYIVRKSDIDRIGATDVQEVKHGKWIPTCDIDGEVAYENCSVCSIQFRAEVVAECGLYCPHCGAKMDGDEK